MPGTGGYRVGIEFTAGRPANCDEHSRGPATLQERFIDVVRQRSHPGDTCSENDARWTDPATSMPLCVRTSLHRSRRDVPDDFGPASYPWTDLFRQFLSLKPCSSSLALPVVRYLYTPITVEFAARGAIVVDIMARHSGQRDEGFIFPIPRVASSGLSARATSREAVLVSFIALYNMSAPSFTGDNVSESSPSFPARSHATSARPSSLVVASRAATSAVLALTLRHNIAAVWCVERRGLGSRRGRNRAFVENTNGNARNASQRIGNRGPWSVAGCPQRCAMYISPSACRWG